MRQKCSWKRNFQRTGSFKIHLPGQGDLKVVFGLFTGASKVLQVEQQVHPDPSDMMAGDILGNSVESLAELSDS